MLIDINTYTGHWPFRQLQNNTCKTRLQLMKQFGVDVSVISNLNGVFYKNTQSANEELYEELKSDRYFNNRFIPLAVIDPIYAGWKDDLSVCVQKMGMKGIRLYPKYHRYDLANPSCVELVKRVRDMGLVVSLSLRMVDSRVSSWLDIDHEWQLKDILPIIQEVPDAKYLILNVVNSTQLSNDEAALLKKTDILIDTSGRAITSLGELLNKYGKDKFAFGTHSPILDSFTGLLRIESLRNNEADGQTK
ncbi:MAG: amidohydrolase family protein, partial [Ginsengibacter sp.]